MAARELCEWQSIFCRAKNLILIYLVAILYGMDFNSLWLQVARMANSIFEKNQGVICEKIPTLIYTIV